MHYLLRQLAIVVLLAFATGSFAQTQKWRNIHQVKKKETIYGIAHQYGITEDELRKANPEMLKPDYKLKKGETVFIPYPKAEESPVVANLPKAKTADDDLRKRAIRVGVMLPLHDKSTDGKRMVEYYRGLLMACDSLKSLGISTDIHAWNTENLTSLNNTLAKPEAAKCDIIIGPFYSEQVRTLSKFSLKHNIKVLIPFSVNTSELYNNPNIFQIYQPQNYQNEDVVKMYINRFQGAHTVIIDCQDDTSQKGPFTALLRRELEKKGMEVSITSLKSTEEQFQNAFSATKQNVVVLNTGRSKELGVVFAKLQGLQAVKPDMKISMMGYTDWLLYTRNYLDNFYKFDTYIPSPFYTSQTTTAADKIQRIYRRNFHADMMPSLPKFALTGFDHGMFFIKGMHEQGATFTGEKAVAGFKAVQSPMNFERVENGGMRNRHIMLIHYTTARMVEQVGGIK